MRQRLRTELERLDDADPFVALGVGYEADATEVRRAFLGVTKEFHPARFARRERDIVRVANEVFLRLKAAYDELRTEERLRRARQRLGDSQHRAPTQPASPRARTEVDEVESAPAPRRAPKRASRTRSRRSVRRPRARSVVDEVRERNEKDQELFEQAVSLCDSGRYAEARSAFHQLAAANAQVKKYRVYLHYARGLEHQDAKRHTDARTEYRRALDLDPEFRAARRAMDRLPGPESGSRGLFSRLFRK